MGEESSVGGFDRRRGFGRAAVVLAIASIGILVAGGCGGSGHGAETDPEKGSDAAILNEALARELTLRNLYAHIQPQLSGPLRARGRRLRAEQHEYVDDVTKSIRGLGGDTEAAAEALDLAAVRGQAALLALAAELESEALEFYVDQAAHLYTPAPRTLDAWLAAGHGAHLALLPDGAG